jgi:hypothetical protein
MKLQTAGKGGMKLPKNLQTGAGLCRRKFVKYMTLWPRAFTAKIPNRCSWVAGLTGVPSMQVRYTNPQMMEQALKIALSVQEAEKHKQI